MKNKIILYTIVALLIGLLIGKYLNGQNKFYSNSDLSLGFGYGNGYGGNGQSRQNGDVNRGNCLSDDCLLVDDVSYPVGELPKEVSEALDRALLDERTALATYKAVISKFGSIRPFSMIVNAEEQHITSLVSIYDKYGLKVPADTVKVTAPATLQSACQIGVDAEIANVALYKEKLLPVVSKYTDITAVFTNLMNASQTKHLPAFERCK